MKLNKTEEKALTTKIKHIVGECDCLPSSKTCTYWKLVDSKEPDWQTKEILKLIKKL